MNVLIYLWLFFRSFRYIYDSIINLINHNEFKIIDIYLTHDIYYLSLIFGVILTISTIGSIYKKAIFIKLTLGLIQLDSIYIIFSLLYSIYKQIYLPVIFTIIIFLLINISIIRFIKNYWLLSYSKTNY